MPYQQCLNYVANIFIDNTRERNYFVLMHPEEYIEGEGIHGFENGKERTHTKRSAFDWITPDILTALCEGDSKAFDLIYLRCFEPIQAFFRLLLHNDTEAEELCQELFARLWENRERIDPERNFRSYLYKSAKSAALNHLEHKQVAHKYVHFRLSGEADFEHAPDAHLMSSELSLLIQISIEQMPEQRRRVFEMSRMEGMTNEEISRNLKIAPATVRAHLHYATKELRELITIMVFFLSL